MITAIISGAMVGFLIAIYQRKSKKNKILINDITSWKNKVRTLLTDLENAQRERDLPLDRNSYLEGKIHTVLNENQMLLTRNDELESLYSLAKEENNKLKFNLIELEERMKDKVTKKDKIQLAKTVLKVGKSPEVKKSAKEVIKKESKKK